MIVGFNHNINYRGVSFHVQTEDSGVKTPHLITLLYHGGTIISSQKTSYADIINVENLESVVEDLAKEQHKGMLRKLKKGEFDQRIVDLGIKINRGPQAEQPEEEIEAETEAVITQAASPTVEFEIDEEKLTPQPEVEITEPEAGSAAGPISDETPEPEAETTDLDDLIFSYLSGDDGKK